MANGTPFIEEFLYRGVDPAFSPNQPSWHVVVRCYVDDMNGNPVLPESHPMNPAQAKAAGYDLPVIFAAMNATAQAQIVSLKAQLATAQAQLLTAGVAAQA